MMLARALRTAARPSGRFYTAVGDRVPDLALDIQFTPKEVSLPQRMKGRKVILLGLPGAFTPT